MINHSSVPSLQTFILLFQYFKGLVNIGLVEEHCLLHDDLECLNVLVIRHLIYIEAWSKERERDRERERTRERREREKGRERESATPRLQH